MTERDQGESRPVESRPDRVVEKGGDHRGVTLDSNIVIKPSPSAPTEPAMPPATPPSQPTSSPATEE